MMPPMGSPMAAGNPNVPPPSVPLSFVFAGGIGLIGFGVVAALASQWAVRAPMDPKTSVAAMHVGMLAFLTTTVLGAVHQFGPVVGMKPLRSPLAGQITMGFMVATAWVLPLGFSLHSKWTLVTGATLALITITIASWNLSSPLSSKTGGIPIIGLRLSIAYLVTTVLFGATYAFDLHWHWFALLDHRVLAHAHLGLVGWIGLTYIAVAEKLWPMFLLAHRPSARSGTWAVSLVASGTLVLATGLLFDWPAVTFVGGIALIGGFAAHLTSLAGAVKHRRRALELLHAYLFVSAAFLVIACIFGIIAGLAPLSTTVRMRLVSVEVMSIVAWVALAVIGHTHKIVPFITYTALRERGIRTNAEGKPLMFGNLFNRRLGWVALIIGTLAFIAMLTGLATATAVLITIGGTGLAITGAVATFNLVNGPLQASRLEPTPIPPRPPMPPKPPAPSSDATQPADPAPAPGTSEPATTSATRST